MEIIKEIKTEERTLKDLDLKVIELNSKNGEDDFYFLEEELTDKLREELKKNNLKFFDDLKIFYSLSYCQGDGFCFIGTIETKKARFKIKHQGNYYHEYSKDIELQNLFKKDKEVYFDEFNKKDEIKAEELTEKFNDLYIEICKELEKYGYALIDNQQNINILSRGFEEWKQENNLLSDLELYDLDYREEETKGYIKICDRGDTFLKGLWIKNLKVKTSEFIKAEIKEYTTKTLI